jgi:hypothetical protein
MAWIIGLASEEEIAAIKKAGYKVDTDLKGIEEFAKPSDDDDSKGIAVFVDCDVQDLLSIITDLDEAG